MVLALAIVLPIDYVFTITTFGGMVEYFKRNPFADIAIIYGITFEVILLAAFVGMVCHIFNKDIL